LKQISLDDLARDYDIDVNNLREELRRRGLSLDDVNIYALNYVPMRLQHIFFELNKLDLIVIETRIIESKLLLICAKI